MGCLPIAGLLFCFPENGLDELLKPVSVGSSPIELITGGTPGEVVASLPCFRGKAMCHNLLVYWFQHRITTGTSPKGCDLPGQIETPDNFNDLIEGAILSYPVAVSDFIAFEQTAIPGQDNSFVLA